MYCVIQEIKNKKANQYGKSKRLEVSETSCTYRDKTTISYWFMNSDEKFERPIKKAYKISIHESYRKNGVVKKNQWVICTMDYYSIAEHSTWIKDFKKSFEWDKLLNDINISEDDLCEIVYKKLDPLISKIQIEYEATDEFIINEKNRNIVKKNILDKNEFKEKYNSDDYDNYYDVFGVLRNEELLNKLKESYRSQKEYESNSQKEYESNTNSNYNSYSGYQEIKHSNYSDKEKENLKKIYKTLAMKFHPDVCGDDGEAMKLINQLKGEWGL